jgi:hypothetical protein
MVADAHHNDVLAHREAWSAIDGWLTERERDRAAIELSR